MLFNVWVQEMFFLVGKDGKRVWEHVLSEWVRMCDEMCVISTCDDLEMYEGNSKF